MNQISLSAAGPDKFYWMRMNEKGRTVTAEDGTKVKVEGKSLFGVREVRGKKYDEILLTTGVRFNLSITKSEALMNSAKEYKGKVPTIERAATKAPTQVKKVASPINLKAIPITKLGEMLKAKNKKTTAVVTKDSRKPIVTKMTGVAVPNNPTAPKNVKIKLSELDLPEIDDFHDTSLPEEFRRYKVVESTGVRVQKINISMDPSWKPEATDTPKDTPEEPKPGI